MFVLLSIDKKVETISFKVCKKMGFQKHEARDYKRYSETLRKKCDFLFFLFESLITLINIVPLHCQSSNFDIFQRQKNE